MTTLLALNWRTIPQRLSCLLILCCALTAQQAPHEAARKPGEKVGASPAAKPRPVAGDPALREEPSQVKAAVPPSTAPPGTAEQKHHDLMQKAIDRSQQIAQQLDGLMGIGVKDLTSGESWFLRGDEVFPTASTIKTAILLELLHQRDQGRIDLNQRVTIRKNMVVGDEGILSQFGDGTTTMSLHDIAATMIADSENSATNILIDRIGMENVNAELRALGITHTLLRRRMLDLPAARAGRENVSTAEDMLALLELIYRGKALSPQSTREYMKLLEIRPKNGTMLTEGVPDAVKVANKPGWLEGVRCDCGIVEEPGRPYEICVFTTLDKVERDAMQAIADVSRTWYEYFHRVAISSEYGRAIPAR